MCHTSSEGYKLEKGITVFVRTLLLLCYTLLVGPYNADSIDDSFGIKRLVFERGFFY